MEDSFFRDSGRGNGLGDDSSAWPLDCALYFSYYYISSTTDHQALDLRTGDPCFRGTQFNWKLSF